jgi:hypothetical protein
VKENLSSNERVQIATDDPLARDHIVRLDANARTESIIWGLLGIISYGRGLMPLGLTNRIGRFGRFFIDFSQEDTTGPQAFLSQAFLRYVCCPPAPVPASRRVVATAASVKAGLATAARATRIVSVSIVLFLVTGQVPQVWFGAGRPVPAMRRSRLALSAFAICE